MVSVFFCVFLTFLEAIVIDEDTDKVLQTFLVDPCVFKKCTFTDSIESLCMFQKNKFSDPKRRPNLPPSFESSACQTDTAVLRIG